MIHGKSQASVSTESPLYRCIPLLRFITAYWARKKGFFQDLTIYLSIYLLIAGTYTPFTLVTLRGAWGWSLLCVIWSLAVLGIGLDLLPKKGRRVLPVVIYLLMGWLILIAINPLLQALTSAGFAWLLSGGLFYTVGVVFYALDEKVSYFHGIWHLFVLAGSLSHYLTVLFYVV